VSSRESLLPWVIGDGYYGGEVEKLEKLVVTVELWLYGKEGLLVMIRRADQW
jgi:hypothetical protein